MKTPHYHFLVVDNLAHAEQLPYLTDPRWLEPLLSLTENPLEEHEHLVCVAYSLIPFDRLEEVISDRIKILEQEYPHLQLISNVQPVTLPFKIPALKVELNHGQIAHELVQHLMDREIKLLHLHTGSPAGLPGPQVSPGLTPGHSLSHPGTLFFVPYR